ncbi:50S ribosomal protein L7/L12 [Spiroplasma endosymbiont of Crioceris asparagi]|uniref:50S ribosomal protein L7/L12 n=1 Tax=Spiroplasma endosymbiont of Crioceris asparagi TaxID=3066286 RepID=UPI0030CA90C6
MAKLTKEDIIKSLEEMKLSELNELVKAIEDHFGVVASAAVAAPAAEGAANAAPTEVDVLLTSPGGNKVAVIKIVKELTGLGLMDAKKLVDGTLPAKLKEKVKPEDGEAIKKQLVDAGASVELK